MSGSLTDFINGANSVIKATGDAATSYETARTATARAKLPPPVTAGNATLPREANSVNNGAAANQQNARKWEFDAQAGLIVVGGLLALWLGIRLVRDAG